MIVEDEIPATTESAGKTAVYTCENCGDSYGGEEIPKLDDAFTMSGDANRDGELTLVDVLRMLKHIVGDSVDINIANSDVDKNLSVTVSDVLLVLNVFLNA